MFYNAVALNNEQILSYRKVIEMPTEKIYCPKCRKRIFDIQLKGEAFIEIKCLHCNNIVRIKKEN